jgi:serine/threonine protein kinase
MPFLKEPNAEPIPGYRLIGPLGRGGFGEVWKCEAPGGLFKAIKFVYGNLNGLDVDGARAAEELRAIEHIKAIRHPFLLSMDRVENISGELVIVTELADKNLHELLTRHQEAGLPGLPRNELLGFLREAAEVLDLLNLQHGLQHLDVKPHNLFVVSNHVKVGDFGLVNSFAAGKLGEGLELRAITPVYAAPEVFQGRITRFCDQYSLAIVYQELLTGTLPFRGKNSRQLLLLHAKGKPELNAVPPADRQVLLRALAKNPEERYPSCAEFIKGLLEADSQPDDTGPALLTIKGTDRTGDDRQRDTDKVCQTLGPVPLDKNPQPASTPSVHGEALAGYRFVDRLACSPLADVWRVRAPDGKKRLVKFVYGLSGQGGRREEEAILLLKSLHHPGLVHTEIVQKDPGRLVIITDFTEDSLRERWKRCQAQKLPGIQSGDLVEHLRSAAETLDYLYQQHSIQHLGLNPRNLLFIHDRLCIADFGLVQLLWLPAGQPVAQRNLRYCAPELLDKHVSRACDQYSLALVYHELLTGAHAFRTEPGQAAGGARNRGKPDLTRLPAAERDVIALALHDDPLRRWPSCTELVAALETVRKEKSLPLPEAAHGFSAVLKGMPQTSPLAPVSAESRDALTRILVELISEAGGDPSAVDGGGMQTLAETSEVLHYRFTAGLPLGAARTKVEAIRKEWYGQAIIEDDRGLRFHVSLPTKFWRQWIGRQPGLDVHVQLARQHALSATPIEVTVQVRPFRCSKKRGGDLLEDIGKSLFESLRASLLVNSERRMQDRLLWPHSLQVSPVSSSGKVGAPIECRGKDISLTGIGFYLPHELNTSQVCVHLPVTLCPSGLSLPATLVRAKRCADGWYDVGALFRLTALRKSNPEQCLQ